MIVKNEGNRNLNQVLNSLRGHIDEAVIIDDGSEVFLPYCVYTSKLK